MKFAEKMLQKSNDLWNAPVPTVAFLGDSVTQGCFEFYRKGDAGETEFETSSSYSADFRHLMSLLYPRVTLNVINAGISGDNAPHGAERLDRDILAFHPDLCVVCFGLNDACSGMGNIGNYVNALRDIFTRLKTAGVEVIFMTPNDICSYVDCRITDEWVRNCIEGLLPVQHEGTLTNYIEAAKKTAADCGVPVCDCYKTWHAMTEAGVDTTNLLANRINHPSREMNWFFAWSLIRTIFDN